MNPIYSLYIREYFTNFRLTINQRSLRLDCTKIISMHAFGVFSGSCALFTKHTNAFFNKNNFKTGSHDTIHTFKNYFATIFSIFNFQFSVITSIQTDT